FVVSVLPPLSARTLCNVPSTAFIPLAILLPTLADLFFSDSVLAVTEVSGGSTFWPTGGLPEPGPYSAGLLSLDGIASTVSPTARACLSAGCVDFSSGGRAGPLSLLR